MIYNFTLPNGVRCILNSISGIYSVSAGILVGAGSAIETAEESGVSHFIEHVNFKGTKKRSAAEISEQIDDLGSQINAFTSRECTCFYVKSIAEHAEETFEILADMFLNSVYSEDELEREKRVIIEEINMYEDTPDELCMTLLSDAYFGKLGYGADILGSAKTVSSFTREDILAYKKKYYTTDNVVVSFAGAISVEKFRALCEKFFGDLPATSAAAFPEVNLNCLCGRSFADKDIEQAHVAIGLKSPASPDKLTYPYCIINGVLGGGMSSRLFQTLREKMGLCYSVYSSLSSYRKCGYTSIYAGVATQNYQKAFDEMLKLTKTLKAEGMTEKEFLRAREQMKSAVVMSEENASSIMHVYGRLLLLENKIRDMKERLDEINSLTLDEVNGVLHDDFDVENIATAAVGKGVKPLGN